MTRKLIIDTDPGVDDLLAIVLALGAPELEVIGLTTVFGNVSIDLTTANALAILEAAQRTDIPVARGAGEPTVGAFNGGAPHVHGDWGLGDLPAAAPATDPVPVDAAEFIIRQATADPGRITIFAIGPLTNLAEAARRSPALPQLVDEVVVMGGNAYVGGNATPTAEANIFQDPEAADAVFGLPWRITMVGLDVTEAVALSPGQISDIGEGHGGLRRMLAAAMAGYQRFHESAIPGYQGLCPHDATALCHLLEPGLFQTVTRKIRVETEGLGRGKTWPAQLGATGRTEPWNGRPDVTIPTTVDAQAVAGFITDRLVSFPA